MSEKIINKQACGHMLVHTAWTLIFSDVLLIRSAAVYQAKECHYKLHVHGLGITITVTTRSEIEFLPQGQS